MLGKFEKKLKAEANILSLFKHCEEILMALYVSRSTDLEIFSVSICVMTRKSSNAVFFPTDSNRKCDGINF